MSSKLTEILDTHINEIKAGHNDTLEQAILGWVDEVIGEDEEQVSDYENATLDEMYHNDNVVMQNKLRAEQRKRAGL